MKSISKQVKALRKRLHNWGIENATITDKDSYGVTVRVEGYDGSFVTFSIWKGEIVSPYVKNCLKLAYAMERMR